MENPNESPLIKVESEVEKKLDEVIELEQKDIKPGSSGWYLFIGVAILIVGIIIYMYFL